MLQDFDLDLPSLWFTALPPRFPVPSMKNQGPTTSTYSYLWEHSSTDGLVKILIAACRFTDDNSTTKVRLTWNDSNPVGTVKAEQKHIPPPADPSPEDLDKAHKAYGENIATWCESSLDQTVGDGECWTLVQHALIDLATTYRANGQTPPLLSQGRSHGHCILFLSASTPGSNSGLLQLADVRRGDILQMKSAHFQIKEQEQPVRQEWGKWTKKGGERNVRLAHHTAVVTGVEGDVVRVVEQNGSVPGAVAHGRYDLATMRQGEWMIYRVVPEGGVETLDAEWD